MNFSLSKRRRTVRKPREPRHRRTLTLEVLEQRRLLTVGPAVDSVDPLGNSHAAPPNTDVSVIYDQEIDPASVSDATFAVHAMQSGGKLLEPDNALSVNANTITLNPAADFKPGELVQATATTAIQNLAGEGSANPFVWQFRTEATGGSGFFADSGHSLGDSESENIALGDLDGDGDLDVFVANQRDNRVWLNDGQGEFADSEQSLGDSRSNAVALGDLDGDGDLDAFLGNGVGHGAPNSVWLNDGLGQFTDSGQILGGSVSETVALGDIDGDGDLDAFVANRWNANKVWLNDADGHFSDSGQHMGGLDSHAVALADLDGDGDLDAFVANGCWFGQPNTVWLNNGLGCFTEGAQRLGNSKTKAVALGDLDGDGDLDAFVATEDEEKVWLNDGDGHFSDSGQRLGGLWSTAVALGDLDGDGDLDAFVANDLNSAPNKVWLNDGLGDFSDSGQGLGDSSSFDVALGDVDSDGDLDAFVANWGQGNKVWVNQDGGPVLGGVVWEDLDQDGVQDAAESGVPRITVRLLDASASTIATTTTDTSGNYAFLEFLPGEYSLEFVAPAGVAFSPQDQGDDDALDSDVNPATGLTTPFMLPGGEYTDRDAGLSGVVASARVSGLAWNDSDGDGIRDLDETAMGGVAVTLLNSQLAGIGTTTTAPDGSYGFAGLWPGEYSLRFVALGGFTLAPMNRGDDDLLDSDANRSTGRTEPFGLITGQDETSHDAGFYGGPFSYDVWSSLRLTEIMFNEPEFIELKNIGSIPLDLTEVRLDEGIVFDFTLGNLTCLFPGESVVVVENLEQFMGSYDTRELNIAAEYEGRLWSVGERIGLVGPAGEAILEFSYDPAWFAITGYVDDFSLTVVDETAHPATWDGRSNWRPSSRQGGSPGADDPRLAPEPGVVVITEIMSNPSDSNNDWIELTNTTGEDIDIGGWYLGDDDNDGEPRFTEYQIEPDTVLPAGGSVVFTRAEHFGFGLSSFGERVQLTAGEEDGNLLGYSESVVFGGAEADVTFGPHVVRNRSADRPEFPSLDVPKDIRGWDTTISTLHLAAIRGRILDVNVTDLYIRHGRGSDLIAQLTSPSGTTVELFSEVPGATASQRAFWDTELNDEAGASITEGTAPCDGSFHPEGRLADFDGEDPNGTWMLTISQAEGIDTGWLQGWSLEINLPRDGTDFVALSAPTPGGPNAEPKVGPVVINELMYHAAFLHDEFIELYNVTADPVDVGDWTIEGIDGYTLPTGMIIPPNGFLLVVPIDPEQFRTKYGVAADVPIAGPYSDSLDNGGENVALYDASDRRILVDRVEYEDGRPWPEEADQGGGSLERVWTDRYGNDPANWNVTTIFGGTPGQRNSMAGNSWSWDGLGDGRWNDIDGTTDASRWVDTDGSSVFQLPDEFTNTVVRTDTVTVSLDSSARDLTVASGTIQIAADATLELAGKLDIHDGAELTCELGDSGNGSIYTRHTATLTGTLTLRAVGNLGNPSAREWGYYARTIVSANGGLVGTFDSTPAPGQHLGYGVFVADPDADVQGIIYDSNTVGVDLFQAAPGDTDGDADVDLSDIMNILAGGKFGDGPSDATWLDGNFDGDLDVDLKDIMMVLATGLFGDGPYVGVKTDADATGNLVTALANLRMRNQLLALVLDAKQREFPTTTSRRPHLASVTDQDAPSTAVPVAHDAVLQQAVDLKPGGKKTSIDKWAWLHEYEQPSVYRPAANDRTAVENAVDKLLAISWQ